MRRWSETVGALRHALGLRGLIAGASLLAILAAGAYAIFALPFALPNRHPTNSTSYAMGFNNKVAILACGMVVLVLALRRLLLGVGKVQAGELLSVSGESVRAHMSKTGLWAMGLVFLVLTLLVYWVTPLIDVSGDRAYFFRRLWRALWCGLTPYREIEFIYGPALIYLPLWVAQAGSWVGISLEQAYLAVYLLLMLGGLWMLFYVVDHCQCQVSYRTVTFVLLAFSFLNVGMALQYTVARFIVPFAALLWLHDALGRWPDTIATTRKAAIAGLVLPAIALAVSPEMGLSYIAAQTVYLLLAAVLVRRTLAWGCLTGPLALLAYLLVFSTGYLISFKGYAEGGNMLPVVPAAHMVLFLASLFYAVPACMVAILRGGDGRSKSIMAGMAVLCVMMIPLALGRCDPGHVLYGGVGVFLLTFALLARYRPRAFVVYAAVFLLVAVIGRYISDLYLHSQDVFEPVRSALCGKLLPPETDPPPLAKVTDYGPLMVPLSFDRNTEYYLCKERRLIVEYYPDFGTIFDPETTAEKLRGLEKAYAVLVPDWVPMVKGRDPTYVPPEMVKDHEAAESAFLGMLFLYPVEYRMEYKRYAPYYMVCLYLTEHFTPVRQEAGQLIMLRSD